MEVCAIQNWDFLDFWDCWDSWALLILLDFMFCPEAIQEISCMPLGDDNM
jgi:hypothetical protein